MAWCPNCRTEYQDGVTVCADCGAKLVAELPEERDMAVVAYISEEELAGKLVEYLGYSEIEAECAYDEAEQSFTVSVDADKLNVAKTAFKAFYSVESKKQLMQDIEDAAKAAKKSDDGIEFDEDVLESIPEEEMSDEEKAAIASAVMAERVYKPAETYVTKADVSREMFSTAVTFLGFAVLLLVFLVLNATNVITIFNNPVSLTMLGLMAAGCCIVGINAVKRSRNAERDAVEEEKLTSALDKWLDENITDETFEELAKEELSEEILYLRRVDIIKEKLLAYCPELDDNYADALIEDFYNRHFED